jgi:tyrosyl-DNA phosphodiesterase 2
MPLVKPIPLPKLSPNRRLTQQSISPQVYQERYSAWRELSSVQSCEDGGRGLQQNSLLKVVSWNIDFASPGPAERAAVAIEYLHKMFGDRSDDLAIVLQEVCQRSAQEILQTRWIQQNFAIVGLNPPRTFQDGIPRPAKYFTLVITPKSLRLENSFRMTLPSEMGRDALFVDIQLCPLSRRPSSERTGVFRLCTTHLESLKEGADLRRRQLELISQMLKKGGDGTNIIAGLVGGDMNAIHDIEHTMHRQMGLKDAWEDESFAYRPNPEHGELDPSFGLLSGHTWGYQSKETEWAPDRLDKFMYTGAIETTPLNETRKPGWLLGRLGVCLTADVPLGLQPLKPDETVQKAWVSDHFGIAIGIRVIP